MPQWRLRARRPSGISEARVNRDADLVAPFLKDAAHFPGGRSAGVVYACSEADVAAVLGGAETVLPIGAQSSLTGGGTPMGDVILSTSRLNHIELVGPQLARVGAGVTLVALDEALSRAGRYYPPAPTFTGAFVGGTIATNAAGAATFKYGTTRDWVQAITVVLPSGDVLDITRGDARAHSDGYFELELERGMVRVGVPTYAMPQVPKVSAGYFAKPGMDLIDLFIGSEGTLGVVTEATLRLVATRPVSSLVFVPFDDRDRGLAFVRRLRDVSRETWRTGDGHGVDIASIEHLDARCLQLLRDDHADRANGVTLSDSARLAILVNLELPVGTSAGDLYDLVAGTGEGRPDDSPVTRFLSLLSEAYCSSRSDPACLEHVEIAVPGDRARMNQLLALREAVPAAVNARIGHAQRTADPRIEKTAADMIVPFERFGALLDYYDNEFRRRGLDAAIWGHISDGNVHPNVIPRSFADVESGREAILEFGREVIRMGGSPLAEHGVGRSRTKQRLLRELYGDRGIEEMRAVKRAIDPASKLAPGVLIPKA
ncbi:MAG TPA: FAD-binding oxidoreductase [Vicinamibacterales bacterium]|jgi:D-lactate dehydrogenase (cytochrome)|nr:FAD-binding oxidoreductase [Vicinamibacterales bacterium]